jgi:hypothetical protein
MAQDRAEYATAPGMEARVRRVTRRRAAQRRAALAAGAIAATFLVGVSFRAGLVGPNHEPAPAAFSPTTDPRYVTGSGADGRDGVTDSTGMQTTPGTSGRVESQASPNTSLRPPQTRLETPKPTPKAGTIKHPPFPVVKMMKKAELKVELVPIKTAMASAVASIAVAGDAVAAPVPAMATATIVCAVDGPTTLKVGETGTFTATAPGASSARWASGLDAATPHVETFAAAGTYEIVLDVTYDGVATMQCHRAVTVEAPPPDPGPVTEPEPEPDPTDPPVDPGSIDPAGEPTVDSTAVSATQVADDQATAGPVPPADDEGGGAGP